jgi:hypothetical protein
LLRDTGERLGSVSDTAEVRILEVERFDALRGDRDAAFKQSVGHAVCRGVDARLRRDAGTDACYTCLEDVECFPVQSLVVADWVDLGEPRKDSRSSKVASWVVPGLELSRDRDGRCAGSEQRV